MMKWLLKILRLRIISYLGQAGSRFNAKRLEISVSALIIIGMIIGSYYLFLKGATFLYHQGEVGSLFLDRMFYVGWTIIFSLLILSNIITALTTLFRSKEVSFLLTMPITYFDIFRIKFLENMAYSSWALLILGFPLTLAYSSVKSLSIGQMAFMLVIGLPPFLIIATGVGLGILLIAVWLSKWVSLRTIFISFIALSVSVFWIYFKLGHQDLPILGDVANFRAVDRYLLNLSRPPFPLMPSHWFAELVHSLSEMNSRNLLFYWLLLATTANVSWVVIGALGRKLYFPTFQIMEWNSNNIKNSVTKTTGSPARWLHWLPTPTRGIVIKDLLQFSRTPQQWVQLVLFGFFIGLYLINLTRIDVKVNSMVPFWRNMIYVFNFGFTGFILAALTVRFVFPLISMEGQAIWIIRTSPFSIGRLFREKFWLSLFVFFPLAELVALMSNYFLQQSATVAIISTLFLLVMSISLISLSIGLGSVYAQFYETNPMKISSGAGGIITIVISMFFVAIMVAAIVTVIYLMNVPGMRNIISWIVAGVLLINGLIIYFPLKWGHRALIQMEI
ncbi:MAG: hypothetical protein ACE5D7_01710 [Fidelibacterota bacterium]